MKYNGTTGAFISAFVPDGTGGLSLATDMAFGPDGNPYVNSLEIGEILKFKGSTGAFMGLFDSARAGYGHSVFLMFGDPTAAGAGNAHPRRAVPYARRNLAAEETHVPLRIQLTRLSSPANP